MFSVLVRILFPNAEFGMRLAEWGWSAGLIAPSAETGKVQQEPNRGAESRGGAKLIPPGVLGDAGNALLRF